MNRRALLTIVVLTASLAFIYLPIGVLGLFSFHDGRAAVPPFSGPTLKWYFAVLEDPKIGQAAVNSVLLGVVSSAISTILGFLAAYGLGRFKLRGDPALRGAILLPMNVSYLVIGMGLLVVLREVNFPLGLTAACLAHIVMTTPLSFAICQTSITADQVRLEMAARDLGATQWMIFRRLTIGLCWPALFASFCLAFTLSWDEFIMTYLLTRFNVTIPISIWSMMRTGLNPETNALGVLVFAVSLILFLTFEFIYFRYAKGGARA